MKVLRVLGIALGSVIAIVLFAGGLMYFLGSRKVARTYAVEPAELEIPSDSASLAHGAYLTRIHGCADCHKKDLSGQVFLDIPPFRATAANLTSGKGGIGGSYSATDFDRAIRHGIKKDGRPVVVMPSAAFHNMSDADIAALIGYLKALPAVNNELPPSEIRAPARIMAAAMFDPAMEVRTEPARADAPARGPTAEYGAYLASVTCAYCHGSDLRGLAKPPIQGSPPAPDLIAAATSWSSAQFKQTLRSGVRPNGVKLNAEYMPFNLTAAMEESDLDALYAHLSKTAK